MAKETQHSDEVIKNWVCSHIDQLIQTYGKTNGNEFKAEIQLADDNGIMHDYTVFLEYSEIDGQDTWVVRNIVRPEQLQ
ncbi:hypothetical protein GCM10023231_26250 [Olivibacter ginsenosidimutans]|uniref:Uncharacterized protein n=1 Tax=Olivibacter ginsenosidimutans TaxID=1176537 RepID=A0ABP9BJJ9_9SPHI